MQLNLNHDYLTINLMSLETAINNVRNINVSG